MEPPSGPPRRGQDPRLGPLLTVSLLIIWSRPITAQLRIELVLFNATEGNDVLLLVRNQPENPFGYSWFKGEKVDQGHQILTYVIDSQQTTPGPAHSGRERIYPNGSLLLQNITQEDSGAYTLQVTKTNLQIELSTGWFRVYQFMTKPTILASNTTVTEHQDSVVLTCLTNHSGVSTRWIFNGQSLRLTERMELSQGNSTLRIDPVRKADEGNYQCEVSNGSHSSESDSLRLIVQNGVFEGDPGLSLSAGAIAGMVTAAGLALTGVLGWFLFLRDSAGAKGQHDLSERWRPASPQGHSGPHNSTSLAPMRDSRAAVSIYEELLKHDANIYCQITPKAEVAQ